MGPKKLSEVKVDPAIAAVFNGLKIAPPKPAAAKGQCPWFVVLFIMVMSFCCPYVHLLSS